MLSGRECERETRREEVLALVSLFTKLDVDNKVSVMAGELRRRYDLTLADCIIAATALGQRAKLWTRDHGDFKQVTQIEVEDPYGQGEASTFGGVRRTD